VPCSLLPSWRCHQRSDGRTACAAAKAHGICSPVWLLCHSRNRDAFNYPSTNVSMTASRGNRLAFVF
jgi:hypothetical protein